MTKTWIGPVCLLFVAMVGVTGYQSTPSHSSQIQNHFRRAAEALKDNSPEVAKQELAAVLALDPKNAEAHGNRGAILFVQGDCSSALPDFRAALAVNPELIKASAMMAICDLRLGNNSARLHLENLFPKLREPKLRTQVGMALAGIYSQQGDLERAATIAQSMVDSDPDNPDVLYLAQLVHTELADDTLNKLAIIAPGSARMQQVIAEHLVNVGDLENAIIHYKKCLELNSSLPGVRFELAQAIQQAAPSDPAVQSQAQSELEAALKMDGDSSKIECALARIALRRSEAELAYSHYTRAVTLNPQDAEGQLGLSRILMGRGKPQEALRCLRAAVESDPLNSEAHYRLASVYRSLHMIPESQKETKLFQEIKQTKNQVRELYRQMNKRPANEDREFDLPQ